MMDPLVSSFINLFSPQPQWTVPSHPKRERPVWGILQRPWSQCFTKATPTSSSSSTFQVAHPAPLQDLAPPQQQPEPAGQEEGPRLQQAGLYPLLPGHPAQVQTSQTSLTQPDPECRQPPTCRDARPLTSEGASVSHREAVSSELQSTPGSSCCCVFSSCSSSCSSSGSGSAPRVSAHRGGGRGGGQRVSGWGLHGWAGL